jgi:two-component system sensor histidine kinase PilS (NtrC family)
MSHTRKRKRHIRFELERSVASALVVARLALATLFLVASIMSGSQHYVFYLAVGVFFLVTGLSLVRARRRFVARMLSTGQIAADMIVITVLTAFEQHGGGLFVFLYLVPIISANLLFRRSGGIIVAGLSGAAYAGLLVASYLMLEPRERPYSGVQCASYASMTFAVFIVVGMLVRQLVERMQRHGLELHQLRSLHQTILVNMNSGLVTTDAANRVIYANRAAEVILDRDGAAIVGEHIGTFFAYRGADGALTTFDPPPERVAQDGSGRAELIGLTPAGKEVQIGYNLSLIPGDDPEQHAGKIMLFTDLTEVKQLEQRLRQADRLRAIGELAASIAHEIRNPLASIAGSIELLGVSTELNEREQRLLRIITNESDRLNHIIEEFLSYARERVPQVAPHSLLGVLEEVLTLFRNNAGVGDAVAIELRAPEEPPYVLADHDQLKQVFFNLLRNATDAMPDGGRIEIEVEPPAPGARDVCVRVHDTGCGIPPAALDHIFEPFYSTKRRGTGVGLALCEKIIRAHHGTIGAESGPERGTTFTLTLPQPETAAVAFEAGARSI